MKITFNLYNTVFKGRREDRNTVSQLKKDNSYALTDPNQRRINSAIENLSNNPGEENLDFILDVASNLKYGTNIPTEKIVKNDWSAKLKNAAETSLAASNPALQDVYRQKIDSVFNNNKALSEDEKILLELKKSILDKSDIDSLKSNKNENIRSLERNLDYFIISSEIPIAQKVYVLNRLDYLMSDEYKINPQLKDKKTLVLAEIVNDLAVNTNESKIPNIKAVNQKNHGMCAAISIARKALAYEDKPNFVDIILSELDDSNNIMVYDRFNLGSGKRVPVKKIPVNFNYAIDKGYRIIDASTTQWMNIANMYGINNENLEDYIAFDKNNFDAFQDSLFVQNFADETLKQKQCYYQILTKAKSEIGAFKSSKIKKSETENIRTQNLFKNIERSRKINSELREKLHILIPELNKNGIQDLSKRLISLQQPTSEKIKKGNPDLIKYSFIPNEENSEKIKKVKQFLIDKTELKDDANLEKNAKTITDLITEIFSLTAQIKPTYTISSEISKARRAYEAEALYRASIVIGLREKDVLTDKLIKYNIPDRESRISDSLGELIKMTESGKHPELIEYFARVFNINPKDKEDIVDGIKSLRANFETETTDVFDDLYYNLGLGGRLDMLHDEVIASIEDIKAGKKQEQKRIAEILNIKADKKTVLKALENFDKKLSQEEVSEKTYNEILNKLGFKNQSMLFIEKFKDAVASLTDDNFPDKEENIKMFKEIHNLPEEAALQDIFNIINNNIGEVFNKVAQDIEIAAQVVEGAKNAYQERISEKGGGLSSLTLDETELVIREMEKRGELVPESDMRKLQERFTKIDKIRSTDEFSSRQGKISRPELYKLSDSEKSAIKLINKKLNAMYSEVSRALNMQYREIKPELEEMMRQIGSAEGTYWMNAEGGSGLNKSQQAKIFEQLTDRPYYEEENLETAIDKIINGVYSGVSGSSVFHDKIGMHAQYIADIKENDSDKKKILLHDNSWGASEHENIWTDSNGLMRTDYSDNRGGELGYITDSEWRNGNYVENLLNKKGSVSPDNIESKNYKKLNPSHNNEFDFSLMPSILISGQNPEYKDIAASIKDTIYVPETNWVSSFEKQLSKMSKAEIERANIGYEEAIKAYKQRFDKIIKRLEKTPLNAGINTKQDFDNLPQNDELKVAFEKIAVKRAYPNYYMYNDMGKAKTISDVKKIENTLKSNAVKDFNYAFGKTEDILLYYAYEHSRYIAEKLIKIFDKNNIKYEVDTPSLILKNTAVYEKNEKSQFTGSIKDTINFVINKTMKQFDENVAENTNSKIARQEFETELRNTLNEIMYFNAKDLESEKFRAQAIRKWIDRTFDPIDDDEFVKIYRKLQDMTTEEFNHYTKNLRDEDLGIKNISGYDVLKSYKAANDKTERDLMNTLFYEEYVKNINTSKTKPNYKYSKTQKSLRGAVYANGRTFDDLYRSFYSTLSVLEYDKMFNKYKDRNYRKYGAFPAYPKTELIKETSLNKVFQSMDDLVSEITSIVNARRSVINSYNLIMKLDNYVNKIADGKPVSKKEYTAINSMVGEFITNNFSDPDMQNAIEAASKLISFEPGTISDNYKPLVKTMLEDFKNIEISNSEAPFSELNKANLEYLKKYCNGFINCNIPPRYQQKVRKDLNIWIKEEFKKRDNSFAKRRTSLELHSLIDEYGIKNKTKVKTDDFTKLQKEINITKIIKFTENYDKNEFKKHYDNAVKLADKFVVNYIKPEHQKRVREILKTWIGNEIKPIKSSTYDRDLSEAAKIKLLEDFTKYHYTKYPMEAFQNYLLSAAKESPNAEYKENLKNWFTNHLTSAMLVEIQDSLMDAVDTGNAAKVKDYFKDYYVYPFESEYPMTMDSEMSISYIVQNLLVDNNIETAKMFVEKLGLADKFLDYQTKIFDNYDLPKRAKMTVNILKAIGKNLEDAKTEFEKLSSAIDKCDNPEQLIEETKQNLINKTKNNKRKSQIKVFLEALDNAKTFIIEQPEARKSHIVNQMLSEAIQEVVEETNNYAGENQKYINLVMNISTFIEQLNLPEYSQAYQKQQALLDKFNAFHKDYAKMIADLQKNNDNIQMQVI